MHLEFKTVEIHNFMSIGHIDLDVHNKGFVSVVGKNNNPQDNSTSNGSGKSSIFESIMWCLTGNTVRGIKNIKRIGCEDGTYVKLTFLVDNDEYVLLRSKDSKEYKTNLQIYVNGENVSGKGIRDSETQLNKYLPDLTESLIGSVIILGQGLPQRFTYNKPAGRKEVLEKLSKSDYMIEDIKQRLSLRKDELNTKIISLRQTINYDEEARVTLENKIAATKNNINNIENTEINYSRIDELTADIEKCELELEHCKSCIDVDNDTLTQLTNNYYNERSNEDSNYLELTRYLSDTRRETLCKISEINSTIKYNKDKINDINNMSDTCPTCGQKLVNFVRPSTDEFSAIVSKCENEKIALESSDKDISGQLSKLNTLHEDKLKSLKDDFDSKCNEIKDRQAQCNEEKNILLIKLKENKSELDEINNLKIKKETELKIIREYLTQYESELVKLSDKILYNNNELQKIDNHLNAVNKMITISSRDFRGYLLSNVISFIDMRCKYYSNYIFNSDLLKFDLDGNNIAITYNNKEFEALSGGEQQKVNLIVQLSIRDMLCKFLNFSSNLLVLDEIFDGLDKYSCDEVLNMITALTDITSIYIVSHHDNLQLPSDNELTVIKNEDGVSSIL